jgi:hypothetical protein
LTIKLNTFPLELLFFSAALTGLYFLNPSTAHVSFCPLAAMGLDFCPGCGLGRSIHYLMHGHLKTSLEMHPLGFFAFGVIILRRFNYIPKNRGHE